jgi:hypothetical protein
MNAQVQGSSHKKRLFQPKNSNHKTSTNKENIHPKFSNTPIKYSNPQVQKASHEKSPFQPATNPKKFQLRNEPFAPKEPAPESTEPVSKNSKLMYELLFGCKYLSKARDANLNLLAKSIQDCNDKYIDNFLNSGKCEPRKARQSFIKNLDVYLKNSKRNPNLTLKSQLETDETRICNPTKDPATQAQTNKRTHLDFEENLLERYPFTYLK